MKEERKGSVRRTFTTRRRRTAQKRALLIGSLCLILFLSCGYVMCSNAQDSREEFIKYYTSIEVQSGDTLWDLADTYGKGHDSRYDYIEEVKQLNHLTDDRITAGVFLTVQYYGSPK